MGEGRIGAESGQRRTCIVTARGDFSPKSARLTARTARTTGNTVPACGRWRLKFLFAGISPNPTLRASAPTASEMKPEQALKAALGQAVDQALTKAIGKPLAHSLVYQSSANIVLVPRHKVDPAYSPPLTQGHWAARIQAGEAVVLAYITQEQLRQGLKSHQSATTVANQREANLLTTLQNSPAAGPDVLVGAITVRKIPCNASAVADRSVRAHAPGLCVKPPASTTTGTPSVVDSTQRLYPGSPEPLSM